MFQHDKAFICMVPKLHLEHNRPRMTIKSPQSHGLVGIEVATLNSFWINMGADYGLDLLIQQQSLTSLKHLWLTRKASGKLSRRLESVRAKMADRLE